MGDGLETVTMANFADDQIISTAGGDANGDFTFPLAGQPSLPAGSYVLSIMGTFGSRTIGVKAEDRSGNQKVLDDEGGTPMTALAANKIVVVTIAEKLTLTMAGTLTALLTITLRRSHS
jgi:hypothetical protein